MVSSGIPRSSSFLFTIFSRYPEILNSFTSQYVFKRWYVSPLTLMARRVCFDMVRERTLLEGFCLAKPTKKIHFLYLVRCCTNHQSFSHTYRVLSLTMLLLRLTMRIVVPSRSTKSPTLYCPGNSSFGRGYQCAPQTTVYRHTIERSPRGNLPHRGRQPFVFHGFEKIRVVSM